ncbi:FAST kinase domain-containing protein 2, mitochondrial isoform X1 [Rhincodon typus]|uniref:FAST kinase domain-containing protein 2, mitochondrial isoform X1 n=1 Tax=Rhincodon typus TaxID=259920 RepID=UPI0009A2BA63|nr:FAST kinase domain-containing protein 2, mitochondrial isoform X1 [Rhincodon typus]XP_048455275.1 FAST kinase domain-containing protein 2, mitochondrial isoform X1 [Rhincodon typus]XP_048455277.1 FAST kinase domain-containing protein 2, mitochondrial isoform X1 [Rhincodon typus]
MTIHSAGNHLVRILRLCSFFSHRCVLTGVRSHATCIQTYRFAPVRRQNGFLYYLGNCLDLKSNRFHSSEKTEYRIPTAVIEREPEDGNIYSREISGVSDPSDGHLSKRTIMQNLEALEEEFVTEQKSLSSAERIKPLEKFFDRLQMCTSPSDVLDLYKESTVTWKQVSNCLMTMWKTTKKMSEDQKRYERKLMFEHPVFEKICQQTLKGAQLMSCSDLSYSLFALVKIGVSQNSRLVHTLLRVIQERLNEFDERALSVLSSCVKNMEDNKSVNALRVGLRLLVELRIPVIKRVMALQTMMRCIGQDAPLPLKKKLENKAISLLNEFTLPNCQYMFVTLAVMDHRSLPLLETCSNRIIENIHSIPFWRLVHILQSCKDLWYRSPALLSAIGNHVAASLAIWQVKQLILFLVLFSELNFRHIELMNAFAQIILAKSESLTLKDVLSVLRVYSLLNHRPDEGWIEQFLQTVSDVFELYLSKCSSQELLRGVYSLCLMGHYPQVALNQLFRDDVLNELCSSASVYREANEQMLQCINLCLELENPSFIRQPVNTTVVDPSLSHSVNAELQKTVDTILGDSSLYQQGLMLKNLLFIDYVIALDQKSKNVVPIPQDDEIGSESDIQRVAVLCAPVSAFCFGTSHPKDRLAMKIRHLKVLGYHAVLVSEHEFGKLSEDERVGFLKSAIFTE